MRGSSAQNSFKLSLPDFKEGAITTPSMEAAGVAEEGGSAPRSPFADLLQEPKQIANRPLICPAKKHTPNTRSLGLRVGLILPYRRHIGMGLSRATSGCMRFRVYPLSTEPTAHCKPTSLQTRMPLPKQGLENLAKEPREELLEP